MKTICFQERLLAFAAILLVAGNQGLTIEPAGIPSFHRVLVVNETSRPAVVQAKSGVLTAALEVKQPDGHWSTIARLRAPAAIANLGLAAGEAWQFVLPESRSGTPAKARLAVKTADGIIYSQPFEANVDPSGSNQTIDCWLARLRISPASSEDASMIAVVDPTPEN